MFKSNFGQQNQSFGGFGQQQQPQQQQNSLFGAPAQASPFGQAAAPAQSSPFGQPSASPFGQPAAAPAAGGTNSAFGSTGSFGNTGGAFGSSGNAFGQPSGSAFGSAPTTGFGSAASATPAFGASTTTNSTFGSSAPAAPAFGGVLSTPGVAAGGGTTQIPYSVQEEREKDARTSQFRTERFQAITMMPQYRNNALQELRWQDYQKNVKGPSAQPAAGFGFAGSNTASQPQSTGSTSLFGQNNSGPFGQTNSTSSFGSNTGSTGLFGQNNQMQTFGGGFGSTAAPSTSQTGFGFGSNSSASTNSPFQQGSAFGAKPTGLGLFGQNNNTNTNTSSGFGFGSANNSSSPFGGAATSTGGFGQTNNAGSAFGQKPSMFGSQTGTGMFGQNTANTAGGLGANQTQGGVFGASQNQTGQNQTGGLFGSGFTHNNQANAPGATGAAGTGFGFGNQAQQSNTGSGLFGQNSSFGQTNQASPFGQAKPAFGSTPAAGAAGGTGLFGSQNSGFGQTTGTASGGLFGQNNANATTQSGTGSGLFGSSAPNTNQGGGGLFGQNNSNANQTGGGLFGQNNANANQTGGGLFGKSTTATNQGGLFGSKPATTGGGLFGNSAPAAPATGGLFGAANANNNAPATNTGGLFGNKPATGGLFGNTAATNANPTAGAGLAAPTNNAPSSLFGTANTPSQGLTGMPTNSLFGNAAQQPAGPVASIDSNAYLSNPLFSSIRPTDGAADALEPAVKSKRESPNFKPPSGILLAQLTAPRPLPRGRRLADTKLIEEEPDKKLPVQKADTPTEPEPESSWQMQLAKFHSALFSNSTDDIILNSEAFDFTKSRQIADVPRASTPTSNGFSLPSAAPAGRLRGANATAEEEEFEILSPSLVQQKDLPFDVPDNEIVDARGYWISPSKRKLLEMTVRETRSVRNFRVGQQQKGFVEFLEPVDLSKYSDFMAQICGHIVSFNDREFCLYPHASERPAPGHGLNVRHRVTLYNIFAHDRETKEAVKDAQHPVAKKLHKKLAAMPGFQSWSASTGTWTFEVDPAK